MQYRVVRPIDGQKELIELTFEQTKVYFFVQLLQQKSHDTVKKAMLIFYETDAQCDQSNFQPSNLTLESESYLALCLKQ